MPDDALLSEYLNGPARLRTAVSGMSREQLLATPVPGKWSSQQVVIHLADAELAFSHRIKRILAEDRPNYNRWQENDFVARLQYEAQSIEDALTTIELLRRQLARVIEKLSETDLDRVGIHQERGEQTARDLIKMTIWHLQHHLDFINEKRGALGLNN